MLWMVANDWDFLTGPQMLMHVIANWGRTNTVRESALKMNSGRKNPQLPQGVEPVMIKQLSHTRNPHPLWSFTPVHGCSRKKICIARGADQQFETLIPVLQQQQKKWHHLHSSLRLRSHFLVHLDEATAVVDKHAVMTAILQVDTKDQVQRLRIFQSSASRQVQSSVSQETSKGDEKLLAKHKNH